jgi:hypothetical protein
MQWESLIDRHNLVRIALMVEYRASGSEPTTIVSGPAANRMNQRLETG